MLYTPPSFPPGRLSMHFASLAFCLNPAVRYPNVNLQIVALMCPYSGATPRRVKVTEGPSFNRRRQPTTSSVNSSNSRTHRGKPRQCLTEPPSSLGNLFNPMLTPSSHAPMCIVEEMGIYLRRTSEGKVGTIFGVRRYPTKSHGTFP